MIWLQFAAVTGVIVFAGWNLSKYGDVIAEKTGLGRTWVGVILMASVTSLPELMTGVSSVAIFAFFFVYAVAMRTIFLFEKKRIAGFIEHKAEVARYDSISLRAAATNYA
jgi:hypothetical protein